MTVASVAVPVQKLTRRRVAWLVVALIIAGVLVWFGWTWQAVRSYKSAMAAVDAEMAAGRFGAAARNLEKLAAGSVNADEAAYVLGICEQSRGRLQAADQAWARVSPGSSFTQRAILARLRLFHDTGRLAAAEQLVEDAASDPRNDRTDLRVLLVPIYSQIGRSDEAAGLIEDRWQDLYQRGEATAEQSIKLVRLHIELVWTERPVEGLRAYLDQAGRQAPDDDRVWLGRANLAIQTGAYDQAARWLDACQRRRPDDPPVWRARLNWAMATNRADVVELAVKRLPVGGRDAARTHRVNAWLASRRGDAAAEVRALEQQLAAAPADVWALDRLIAVADKAGQPARAAELAGKKALVAQLRDRYLKLNDRTQASRDAAELARLAEQLGNPFQARVFRTLIVGDRVDRSDNKSPPLSGRGGFRVR